MDLSWVAPTLLALGSLIGSVVAAVVALRVSAKQDVLGVTVAEVKRTTDGMLHAAVADAGQKGRAEGAAIATAGAAAGQSVVPSAAPVPVVETKPQERENK